MKVLVTGAPGWLANRFLEVLRDGADGLPPRDDWQVRCLVLKGTDARALRELAAPRAVELVEGDVTDAPGLAAAVRDIDAVVHLAGVIHPRRVRELYAVNARGTGNLLQAARAAGVRRFVFVSSNSVCGTNRDRARLMTEDDVPRPYLNYGRSKRLAELAVRDAHAPGSFETVILRPCWYYGPNQPERQTTFFRMIAKGNPLVFGDGNNLRSMSYVDNTCQALVLAVERPAASGRTYWIADARPYTSNEIYRTVAALLGVKRYRPRHLPGLVSEGCLLADRALQALGFYVKEIHVAGEMNKDIACSVERARTELGYDPKVALEEGMRRSIEWCRRKGTL